MARTRKTVKKSLSAKPDAGIFNKNQELYRNLVEQMYNDNPPVMLPSEYASFIKDNLLRFFIRLSRYKFVARMVKKSDRVLEIGCGSGLGSIFLSQHCAHVTGLDVKQGEIDEAKDLNRRSNVDFIVDNFLSMKKSRKYDVVVALDVIEHMEIAMGKKLLRAMAQSCLPEGMVIIGTPSIYSYQYQSELSKASHVHCYDQQELCDLIGNYFGRTLPFSMNDEMIHTGFPKMAWYYFIIALPPK